MSNHTQEMQVRKRVRAWWADTAILVVCTMLAELALHEAVTSDGVRLSSAALKWIDAVGMAAIIGPLFGWTLYRRHVDMKFARPTQRSSGYGSPHAKVRLVLLGALGVLGLVVGAGLYLPHTALSTAVESGTTLNLAGRQRTNSLAIALAATVADENARRAALRDAAAVLAAESVRMDAAVEHLLRDDEPDVRLVEARREATAQRAALLAGVARALATPGPTDPAALRQRAVKAQIAQDLFTTELAQYVNRDIAGVQRGQRALFVLFMALLIGFGGLVVEPVVRLLRRQHNAVAAKSLEYERLAMVAQRTSNAVVITDAERKITWANEGFTRVTGWELHEVMGKSPGAVLQSEQTDPAVVAQLHGALNAGEPVRVNILNVTKTGEPYWLDLNIEPLYENGQVTGFLAVESDITEQVLAREALQREREALERTTAQLEEAQTLARIGNWEFDFATGQVEWSPGIYLLFGREPELGNPSLEEVLAGYDPEDVSRLTAAIERSSRTGEAYSMVLRTSGQNPMVRWVRADGRARRGADRSIVGLYGTATDVTESIEREEALRQAQERAEAANRSKSEFLANMSHEIRTPLTAILGYTDLLRDEAAGAGATTEQLQAMDTIRRAGEHLLTVINDILDISKIEAGKLQIERVTTPLPSVLLDVESLMRARAQAKGVSLENRILTPVPDRIVSDPTRLRQILMNLVGNAAKFTERGRILMETSVELERGGETLVIAVDDTGPGMSDEQAAQLFQPFTQADSSVTRKHGGTGLGLTICRRLAELMGGNVELVTTALGRGSRFELRLPLQTATDARPVHRLEPAVTTTVQQPASPRALNGRRILLAEDGEDNQRLINVLLRAAGADVTIVSNGRQALEAIEWAEAGGAPFDLLLTDMQMPEMDGYSLAAALRATHRTMPIVALTAHAMADDRQKCLDAGCDDYATKPIDRQALIATCARWLAPVELFTASTTDAVSAGESDVNVATADVPSVLVSELADDPDLAELAQTFAEALPSRVAAIAALHGAGDATAAARLTHQLKGAAGSYGFPDVSEVARQLEHALGHDAHDAERLLARIAAYADAARRGVSADVRSAA